jgi:hypothetical protein
MNVIYIELPIFELDYLLLCLSSRIGSLYMCIQEIVRHVTINVEIIYLLTQEII